MAKRVTFKLLCNMAERINKDVVYEDTKLIITHDSVWGYGITNCMNHHIECGAKARDVYLYLRGVMRGMELEVYTPDDECLYKTPYAIIRREN